MNIFEQAVITAKLNDIRVLTDGIKLEKAALITENKALKIETETLRKQLNDRPVFQVCPKCDGQGIVSKPPYVPGDIQSWSAANAGPYKCPVCNGNKLIPSTYLIGK